MSRQVRNAVVSLSFANVCFLSAWLVLLNPAHYAYYTWPAYPGFVELIALGIAIGTLALLFWVAATIVNRVRSRKIRQVARVVLLLSLSQPLNSFLGDYANISLLGVLQTHRWALIIGFALAVVILLVILRFNRHLTRVAIALLIILSPLALVNLVSAIWLRNKYMSAPVAFRERHTASNVVTRPNTPRVLWIVFDELDQNTAFIRRPASVSLPEFDRFRSESMSSANAYPPNKFTEFSLPALITGHLLAYATPVAPNEMVLSLIDGEERKWSTETNVFSQARAEGFSTGLVGWYHPYCRVIGDSLDSCSWVPVVDLINPALDRLSLTKALWIWARTALYRIPFAFRCLEWQYERQRKMEHQEELERVSHLADKLLQEDLNLKLLHVPIPHHPWIYDRRSQSLSSSPGNGYLDNLALADRTLGQVRRALENNSQWDNSIVLVTADHWWRTSDLVRGKRDHRIPFMLKLAGQKVGVEYKKSFNTILTRELLLQLLRQKLTTPDDVVAWIDSNSKLGESPVTIGEE